MTSEAKLDTCNFKAPQNKSDHYLSVNDVIWMELIFAFIFLPESELKILSLKYPNLFSK